MAQSRTKNVSVNMSIGLVCQIVNLILSFLSRTIFINTLGAEYLGVNGLFSNILSILSFAELGIGNAIIFSMYEPLAKGDRQKLGSLMALYKKAYTWIGGIIISVGAAVTPFLNFIIKDKPDISESIYGIYLLFLANTAFSYFFVYKKSIIIADQKNYIVVFVTEIVHVLQVIAQVVFLLTTRNFVLYLITQLFFTVLGNLAASVIADKLYPFLKSKAAPLEKSETKRIFKNVRSLAVYKFGSVILNGTDNILISALVGVTEVGLVSNYILLNSSCNAILGKIADAFTASVGNLNVYKDKQKQYEIFNKIFFITAWLYGFASVGLIIVSPSFIEAWIGPSYWLDSATAIALVVGFYVKAVHFAAYTYRTTLGFFNEGKISPLLAAVLNVIFSVALWKLFGLAGIFIATPLARVLSTGIVDPVLIYRRTFQKNPLIYYAMYAAYVLLFVLLGILCYFAVSLISVGGWLGVILEILTVTVIFNACMVLLFHRTKMFREIYHQGLRLLHLKK